MSKSLCCLAFETLYTKINSITEKMSLFAYMSVLNESLDSFPQKSPLFITWNKNSNLRGCIGTFLPQEIEIGIQRFSLSASLKDPRFPPVRKSEFSDLEVSITLLDNFTPISNCTDWTIGMHGLKLSINYEGEYYSGTFLPIVAEEQGWDRETTLRYLLKKADFEASVENDVVRFYNKGISEGWVNLERYDGIKMSMASDEFFEIRDTLNQ